MAVHDKRYGVRASRTGWQVYDKENPAHASHISYRTYFAACMAASVLNDQQ